MSTKWRLEAEVGALTLEKTQVHSHNKLKSNTKTKINRKPEAKCGSEMN